MTTTPGLGTLAAATVGALGVLLSGWLIVTGLRGVAEARAALRRHDDGIEALAARALRHARSRRLDGLADRLDLLEGHVTELREILAVDDDDDAPDGYRSGWATCWWCGTRAMHVWPLAADDCQLECSECGLSAVVPDADADVAGFGPDGVARGSPPR